MSFAVKTLRANRKDRKVREKGSLLAATAMGIPEGQGGRKLNLIIDAVASTVI